MKKIGKYEGDLWVVVNEEGLATHALKSEPSLEEKQGFVGGLIEYAPVVKGAVAPVPINMVEAKLAKVVSVIVDEEGLLKNKEANTIATYAAYQEPFNSETRRPLVGSAIMHLRISADDEVVSYEDMLRLVSGETEVKSGFWLSGITHYLDEVSV